MGKVGTVWCSVGYRGVRARLDDSGWMCCIARMSGPDSGVRRGGWAVRSGRVDWTYAREGGRGGLSAIDYGWDGVEGGEW